MTMEMAMSQSVGGKRSPAAKIPEMMFEMQIDIVDVAPNGDVSATFVFTKSDVVDDPSTSKQVIDAMRTALKSVEGMRGRAVVTNRGLAKSAEIDVPENADPRIKQQMDSMKDSLANFCAPVPEEPVGIGAVWEYKAPITSSGVKTIQTSIFTLTGFKDETMELDIELVQSAAEQDVGSPTLPAGASLRLNALKSGGSGKSKMTLTSVWPEQASAKVASESSFTYVDNSGSQRVEQLVDLTVSLLVIETQMIDDVPPPSDSKMPPSE
jgi:hypothetical protein